MSDTNPGPVTPESSQPVSGDAPQGAAGPKPGIALCLSGGGYRAMIFHLGALWRINQLGFLKKLSRVSSVSGGSITAGVLALAWRNLQFDGNGVATNLEDLVINRLRRFANNTIDQGSIIKGILLPRHSIADEVTEAYRDHLFGKATLQDLPADNEGPRFIINATNVQSKVLWRFSRPYMGDYRVGLVNNPTHRDRSRSRSVVRVSTVSFSRPGRSATVRLRSKHLRGSQRRRVPDNRRTHRRRRLRQSWFGNGVEELRYDSCERRRWSSCRRTRSRTRLGATLVSHPGLIDNQVRSLRKRQVIDSYKQGVRKGTYWGIRTNIADYALPDALNCPFTETLKLANTATRLKALEATLQEKIINWGYAVCDAGLRRHVDGTLPPPVAFPYPASGV